MATPRPMRATRNCTTTDTWRGLGQRPEDQEGRGDGDDGHEQGHQGHQRAEDEEQHHQRAEAAEEHLHQHARPVSAPLIARQRVEAGDADRRARHLEAVGRRLGLVEGTPGGVEGRVGGRVPEDAEGGAPVLETKMRSPVLANEDARDPGTDAAMRPKAAASSRRTPGESTVVPSGSCTTGTSGPLTRGPPLP